MRLTQQDDASVQDLARVLQADPALSGRILKCANSVKFGAQQPIAALSDAVVRLGMRMVSQLSLGFSLLSNHHKGACEAFDYPRFWSQSLGTAVCMQLLNRGRSTIPAEEAFSFGLLSNIGHLALACVHPERYSDMLSKSASEPLEKLLEAEVREFALHHVDLTSAMLEDWGLPDIFIRTMESYEEIIGKVGGNTTKEEKLASQLRLAVQMAAIYASEEETSARHIEDLYPLAEVCGLDRSELEELFTSAAAEWQAWGEILDVKTKESRSLQDIAAAAKENASQTGGGESENDAVRVLVVDDSPIDLRFVSANLESDGFVVATASNGKDGLGLALEFEPQIILTDLVMPDMDGLELCRALRSAEETQQIYIIVLTGCDTKEKLVETFDAGADDHVVKPFDPQALKARMRAARRIVDLQEKIKKEQASIQRFAAELSVANRKLQHTSLTDSLTDLPNRRFAMDRLAEAWDKPRGGAGSPLTCMIIDIDKFKRVNDNYGHDVGDLVLREIADILRGSLRGADVACRFGGEEFLVICDGLDPDNAAKLAERLRRAVAGHEVGVPSFAEKITVSIGVACRNENTRDLEQLIKLADQALYAAKKGGRNRVCRAK